MRTCIDRVRKALDNPVPPTNIWQQSFDHETPEYYRRLCSLPPIDLPAIDLSKYALNVVYKEIDSQPLDGDNLVNYTRVCASAGTHLLVRDLYDYALDFTYNEVQPDLFRWVLPFSLQAFEDSLLHPGDSRFAGFAEQFWSALAKRSAFPEVLSSEEQYAVMEFMRDAILDAMDREQGLSFSDAKAGIYRWIAHLGSFCVVFPHLSSLWEIWWRLDSVGFCTSALQCVSCLMYKDDGNPIFSPWTPDKGGGPPSVFEFAGLIFDQAWQPANVKYIQSTLNVAFLHDRLRTATAFLRGKIDSDIPKRMLDDFPEQMKLVMLRLGELPRLLATPHLGGRIVGFSS